MAYKREGDTITLAMTLTPGQWQELIFALGVAAGVHMKEGNDGMFRSLVQLVNEMNVGNPDFVPYETSEAKS
jgi:hypothetical protein